MLSSVMHCTCLLSLSVTAQVTLCERFDFLIPLQKQATPYIEEFLKLKKKSVLVIYYHVANYPNT